MTGLPTKDQLNAYLRADESDMDRPDWDAPGGVLETCEEPVAEAYRALGLWRDDPHDSDMPSLDEVIENSVVTDFLIGTGNDEKDRIREWVLANYNLKD